MEGETQFVTTAHTRSLNESERRIILTLFRIRLDAPPPHGEEEANRRAAFLGEMELVENRSSLKLKRLIYAGKDKRLNLAQVLVAAPDYGEPVGLYSTFMPEGVEIIGLLDQAMEEKRELISIEIMRKQSELDKDRRCIDELTAKHFSGLYIGY